MTVSEAKEKLKYIEDIPGGPTLLDLSKIRFDIDEVEWILTRYNKPDSFSPDDHGPVCSKLVFKGSEDFDSLKLFDVVAAMDRFRIDRDTCDRIFDMSYKTVLMDLAVKFGIKHSGSSISDIKIDREDAARYPQFLQLLDQAQEQAELFRQQMNIDHALWAFPESFDMTIENVIKHRADEPRRICGADVPKERNEMVKLILSEYK